MFKKLRYLLISCLLLFLAIEVLLAIATHAFDLKIEAPIYSFENTQGFWFDLNQDFGTCHLSNHSYRQKKGCYDITYKSNSYGFRDVERSTSSTDSRTVVMGDSFVEGVGVELDERLTNLLEVATQKPHLNFGMAGNFGTTQYMLAYEKLASAFDHDAVLIGILPANDFIDDDYELGHAGMSNRYRPYLQGSYPNYELVYFQDSLHKSGVAGPKSKPIKKAFKNFTYSYNAFLYFRTAIRQLSVSADDVLSYDELPGYFNYTAEQLNRVKYALEQIRATAGNRPITVFTIPTIDDIAAFKAGSENTLGQELSAFCEAQKITYVDLLPETSSMAQGQCEALFLSCDGHWSETGNSWAAAVLGNN